MIEKKEYIEKKAAINAILDDFCTEATDAIRVIKEMPTTDIIEVVKCADCKMHNKFNKKLGFSMCKKWGNITKEDDFCSYGEQREGRGNDAA